MKMRKSLHRTLSMFVCVTTILSLTTNTASAYSNDSKEIADQNEIIYTYQVDEETINAEIQKQIDEIIASVEESEAGFYGNHDYETDYRTEYVYPSREKATTGGFPSGQLPGGIKFAHPGGAFYWEPYGGDTITTSVNISGSVDFKMVTLAIDLGYANQSSSSIGAMQFVSDTQHYVKLFTTVTYEVQPILIYKVHKVTGERVPFMATSSSTLYSYALSISRVS
ncbi:MAG: hypothetical protein HFF33_07325 [Oscillospiraceae bacterium]|jgi:hypothetical protein|nr:hypothetical protein [Oscillospiraceae bacterium]